jgi:broad specificity phosphatase PhoE
MHALHELVLVRHGQSTANASGVWQGQSEYPLSDEGRLQARLAGLALRGERFGAIYSSPLERAFETAEIIAREAGLTVPVVRVAGLSERAGGILEGKTWAEQEERSPELAKKFLSLPEEERWSLVGAETDGEVLARFERAVAEIRDRHPGGERLVVVSHGGAMRAFLRSRFGPGVLPGTQRAPNASLTRLAWGLNGDGPDLLELASADHLTPGHNLGPTTVE